MLIASAWVPERQVFILEEASGRRAKGQFFLSLERKT